MDLTFKDDHTYNCNDDQNGSENTEEQIQTPDRAGMFVILFHHDYCGFSCFAESNVTIQPSNFGNLQFY